MYERAIMSCCTSVNCRAYKNCDLDCDAVWICKFQTRSWGASSPLCWFNNKECLCITRPVKHNYILLISTVRIQLHVSVSTWRWSTYRTETCSCILTVLISKIYLCLTVRVIHKNSSLFKEDVRKSFDFVFSAERARKFLRNFSNSPAVSIKQRMCTFHLIRI